MRHRQNDGELVRRIVIRLGTELEAGAKDGRCQHFRLRVNDSDTESRAATSEQSDRSKRIAAACMHVRMPRTDLHDRHPPPQAQSWPRVELRVRVLGRLDQRTRARGGGGGQETIGLECKHVIAWSNRTDTTQNGDVKQMSSNAHSWRSNLS